MNFPEETIPLRDGRLVTLRQQSDETAQLYHAYLKVLTLESPWIGVQHHEVDDVEVLRKKISGINNSPGGLTLGIFDQEGSMVGDLFYACPKREKTRHAAMLGLALLKAYRGLGLGRLIMERAISCARQDPQVLKIELGVFESNTAALGLYQSLGFETEGKLLKKFIQPDGSFHHEILMGLWIGD